jgi:diguanylate cyclase (GGDEF)-like protein
MNEMTRSRYWLALADLDNFKSINDSLGHLMGDEVLVRTGQAMRESLRDEDMVFRYGGEEFAIIVEAEDPATAQIAVDRVRRRIEQLNISAVGKVTASFGVAELDADTFHITSIESADKALYESKTSGKNKITFSHLCNSANASRFDDIEFF